MRGRIGSVLVMAAMAAAGQAADIEPIETSTGVAMLRLPGGAFTMGDANGEVDETPHEVTVGAFYIDVTEVTQDSYERLMRDNPSKFPGRQNPVEQIRFSDAARYCNARSAEEGLDPCYDLKAWTCDFEANGYRLPTEAEWEYAARAGADTAYAFGDDPKDLKRYGWFKDTAGGKPRPVAQRRPNAWGLYDMHGNVWEWCNDFYGVGYYRQSPATDPLGPETGEKRVLRGGAWSSTADACRSAYRYNEDPAYADVCFGYDIYGFRCVRRTGDGER